MNKRPLGDSSEPRTLYNWSPHHVLYVNNIQGREKMEKWGLGKVSLLVMLPKPGTDQKHKRVLEQESNSETIG